MKKQTFIIATIAVAIFMAACTDEDAKPSNSVTPDNGNEEPEEIDWEDPQTGQTATVFVGNVKFDMVYVEKGTFRQLIPYYRTGQFGIRVLDTVLMEERTIEDSFLIGKFEVTQRQWLSVSTYNPSEDQSDPDLPVTNIHQTQMSRFIDTLNAITGLEFRMPNFLEWQYAAKGGNHSLHFLYAGSNNIDEVAWYSANSGGRPHRVGQLRPNELGLYDMSGNVFEWCSDWYGKYNATPQTNPQGPQDGGYRCLRGGCWLGENNSCRVTYRSYDATGSMLLNNGFRLVME